MQDAAKANSSKLRLKMLVTLLFIKCITSPIESNKILLEDLQLVFT